MLSKRSRDFRALTCDMTGDWTMTHGRLVGSMHGSGAFLGFGLKLPQQIEEEHGGI